MVKYIDEMGNLRRSRAGQPNRKPFPGQGIRPRRITTVVRSTIDEVVRAVRRFFTPLPASRRIEADPMLRLIMQAGNVPREVGKMIRDRIPVRRNLPHIDLGHGQGNLIGYAAYGPTSPYVETDRMLN
jgi:hypothetical protein